MTDLKQTPLDKDANQNKSTEYEGRNNDNQQQLTGISPITRTYQVTENQSLADNEYKMFSAQQASRKLSKPERFIFQSEKSARGPAGIDAENDKDYN
jgi:hypothetical protein